MIPKVALELAELVSTDETRFALQGLRVAPGHVVETDLHQLVKVEFKPLASEHFPKHEGFKATGEFKPFLLPRDAALRVAKAIPKKSTIPVLQYAGVGEGVDDNGTVGPSSCWSRIWNATR